MTNWYRSINKRHAFVFLGMLLLFLLSCQNNQTETQTATAQAVVTKPATGEELYVSYCVICHGEKGDGNFAEMLTIPPSDLTLIAARRGGDFPNDEIFEIIDGRANIKSHGSRDMPIWGDTFKESEHLANEEEVQASIQRVVDYLKTIQRAGEQES